MTNGDGDETVPNPDLTTQYGKISSDLLTTLGEAEAPGGGAHTDPDTIKAINQARQNVLAEIQNQLIVESRLRPKLTEEAKLMSQVEDELGRTRKLFDNQDALTTFRRKTEINNYYDLRSQAYTKIYKNAILVLVVLFFVAFLVKQNIIPSGAGGFLNIVTLVIGAIVLLGQYLDITARDNMNFDEYDYSASKGGISTGGGKGGRIRFCFDDSCCSKGMEFDIKKGKCVLKTPAKK